MSQSRPRSAPATRAAILAAARARFAAEGYDRTTLRAIAGDVGVDAAMVIRCFSSKEALFAEAAEFDVRLPDLTGVRPEDLAEVLLPHFFAVWEEDATFLALLRASATSPNAAEKMREVLATQVAPAMAVVVPDHPVERAGVFGCLMLGYSRHMGSPPLLVQQVPIKCLPGPADGVTRSSLSRTSSA